MNKKAVMISLAAAVLFAGCSEITEVVPEVTTLPRREITDIPFSETTAETVDETTQTDASEDSLLNKLDELISDFDKTEASSETEESTEITTSETEIRTTAATTTTRAVTTTRATTTAAVTTTRATTTAAATTTRVTTTAAATTTTPDPIFDDSEEPDTFVSYTFVSDGDFVEDYTEKPETTAVPENTRVTRATTTFPTRPQTTAETTKVTTTVSRVTRATTGSVTRPKTSAKTEPVTTTVSRVTRKTTVWEARQGAGSEELTETVERYGVIPSELVPVTPSEIPSHPANE